MRSITGKSKVLQSVVSKNLVDGIQSEGLRSKFLIFLHVMYYEQKCLRVRKAL